MLFFATVGSKDFLIYCIALDAIRQAYVNLKGVSKI